MTFKPELVTVTQFKDITGELHNTIDAAIDATRFHELTRFFTQHWTKMDAPSDAAIIVNAHRTLLREILS